MKSQRDNLLDLYNRKGFSYVPVEFELCPHLDEVFKRTIKSKISYEEYFDMPGRGLTGMKSVPADHHRFDRYHPVIDGRTNKNRGRQRRSFPDPYASAGTGGAVGEYHRICGRLQKFLLRIITAS